MSIHIPLIDAGTWIGHWPFLKLRYHKPDTLMEKLKSHQIQQAYVSPIETMFEQDPLRANREILELLKDDFFSPVPVVDLSYPNWQDTVQLAAQDERVRMVKLLPNYHRYELDEKKIEPLVEQAQQHQLIIAIQIRFEDMRGMHPLMIVPDVDVLKASKTASFFPEQRFIFHNLYVNEVIHVLHSQQNVWVDLPYLDHADIMLHLKNQFTLNNILFASHSPFLVTESAVSKLKYTDVSPEDVAKVAQGNASALFS